MRPLLLNLNGSAPATDKRSAMVCRAIQCSWPRFGQGLRCQLLPTTYRPPQRIDALVNLPQREQRRRRALSAVVETDAPCRRGLPAAIVAKVMVMVVMMMMMAVVAVAWINVIVA